MLARLLAGVAALAAGAAAATAAAPRTAPEPAPVPTQAPARTPEAVPAEQVYSNIRAFRGTPAEQILPAMELIAASLGVACDHCHVGGGEFEADDKPAKRTAREMIAMMRSINRDSFDGERLVTCWSCHRGGQRPATEPPAGGGEAAPLEVHTGSEGGEPEPVPGVTAAQVLARYLEAIGGAEAARAVALRTARGTATLHGGLEVPVEVVQEATGRTSTTLELPGGALVSVVDGAVGTVEAPGRPPREMNGAARAVAAVTDDLGWVTRPGALLADPRVVGRRTVGGREVLVVAAEVAGSRVELSFGRERGLLRRVAAWAETPVGRLPARVDLDDYRQVDGLATPATWTFAGPQGVYTIHLTEIEQRTAAEAAAGAPPS